MTFVEELAQLINRRSMEGRSNTPDFVLAEYLSSCLRAYEAAVIARGELHLHGPRSADQPSAFACPNGVWHECGRTVCNSKMACMERATGPRNPPTAWDLQNPDKTGGGVAGASDPTSPSTTPATGRR